MSLFDGQPIKNATITRAAGFSPDRTYRYWLFRGWGNTAAKPWTEDRALVVIGLNPSTADETHDDPTIRRCMSFARRWGHGGLVMLNLFAFRSPAPEGLLSTVDPIGSANDQTLTEWTHGRRVLCAWGVPGAINGRGAIVAKLLRALGRDLICLGLTKDGHPKHPLYLKADTKPVPFVVASA